MLVQGGFEVAGTGISARYGQGFVCRQQDFFGPTGPPMLPTPLNPYQCFVLVPLGSQTASATIIVEAQQQVVLRVIEISGDVVSVAPKELTLKPRELAEIELTLKIPENADTANLRIVLHAELAKS